jgi:hypothetical protein
MQLILVNNESMLKKFFLGFIVAFFLFLTPVKFAFADEFQLTSYLWNSHTGISTFHYTGVDLTGCTYAEFGTPDNQHSNAITCTANTIEIPMGSFSLTPNFFIRVFGVSGGMVQTNDQAIPNGDNPIELILGDTTNLVAGMQSSSLGILPNLLPIAGVLLITIIMVSFGIKILIQIIRGDEVSFRWGNK